MSEQIEYEVGSDGLVANIRTVDGEKYEVRAELMDKGYEPKKVKKDRWYSFKAAVCRQQPGRWYRYPGWLNENELRLVQGALSRHKTDRTWRFLLDGRGLEWQVETGDVLVVKVTGGKE